MRYAFAKGFDPCKHEFLTCADLFDEHFVQPFMIAVTQLLSVQVKISIIQAFCPAHDLHSPIGFTSISAWLPTTPNPGQ